MVILAEEQVKLRLMIPATLRTQSRVRMPPWRALTQNRIRADGEEADIRPNRAIYTADARPQKYQGVQPSRTRTMPKHAHMHADKHTKTHAL